MSEPLTSNQAYLDAALRHAVGVRRLTAGEVKRVLGVLETADRELSVKLRKHLSILSGKPVDFKGKRIKLLLADVRVARSVAMKQIKDMMRETLVDVAKAEERLERQMLTASLPINVQLATVDVPTLRALVTSVPFAAGAGQSRTLQQWFDGVSAADQQRLIGAVQQGIAQGETVGEIMRRVSGTRAGGFKDGVLAVSRRNAEALVRTAVSHVSNSAREAVWLANADIIAGKMLVATLDSRTTKICISRDGKVAPVGDKPIPKDAAPLIPPTAKLPFHVNERSVFVAVIDAEGIDTLAGSNRPFVRDLRTGKKRQRDFRPEAKAKAGSRWKSMSRTQRNAAVGRARKAWATASVGQVPAKVTYQEWLKTQPLSFQEGVLGKAKARLFRDGGITVDQFMDRAGGELTLEQLSKTNPAAFLAAGIDLDNI